MEDGMVDRLRDEVMLVTGSTKGIGRSIAELSAAEGAAVVVTGRTTERGEEVAEGIRSRGGRAVFLHTDVSREDDIAHGVETAVRNFGTLTTLVNNAAPLELMTGAGAIDDALWKLSDDQWDQIIDPMVKGIMWTARHAVPVMADAGGGSIVNISSITGHLASRHSAAYVAAKAAMAGLTRSLAVDAAEFGIRCNAIAVGTVDTGEAYRQHTDPEVAGAIRNLTLTRRGMPTDIAYLAIYLASRESEFVTGTVMNADGGTTCKLPMPSMRRLGSLPSGEAPGVAS
jgi:NAD(P)-dependent dehydrogenase (short-subunit alcohol dehydrogenase family)